MDRFFWNRLIVKTLTDKIENTADDTKCDHFGTKTGKNINSLLWLYTYLL
jgi:hypothetical protein